MSEINWLREAIRQFHRPVDIARLHHLLKEQNE